MEQSGLREMQSRLAAATNLGGLKYEKIATPHFATPNEIDIKKIEPILVPVADGLTSKIWSYALTKWTVPVSAGYGRRMRFLVVDRQNEKLIGLFGLCDPLISSSIRDKNIGWDRQTKLIRLYNCLTAYILGAVPPYNLVLGSKLVALATMFPAVRQSFREKYRKQPTIISQKSRLSELAYIDTYGAFGKSAIYTRLINWKFVDYTQGKSHIHLTANGSWETVRRFVPDDSFSTYKYGNGSNWKLRTLRVGLENLGFNEDILSIGWKRSYYACPLASNWQEFLTGQTNTPKSLGLTRHDLIDYWRSRWIEPRRDYLEENLKTFVQVM